MLLGDVPAEGLEEGIQELKTKLLLFVVKGLKDLAVAGEAVYEVGDEGRRIRTHCRSE